MSALPPLRRWDNVAQPRAAVHVVHGMGEHGGRYARLADRLNDARFVVWAHDHRGHGRNPTPPAGLGHFADRNGWRKLVDDAWSVSQEMHRAFPGLPLVLFAHSMGSFVGQYLLSEHGAAYHAVVLSGTNGAPGVQEAFARALARLQRLLRGSRAPGTWVTSTVFGRYNRGFAPTRTACDWLTRDPDEVDRYLADPLCGVSLTAQAWVDVMNARLPLGRREFLQTIPRNIPIHIIAGSRDPVGEDRRGVDRLVRAYERAGLTCVSLRVYDEGRHEMINEINRGEVIADLVEWLDAVVESR